jgi:transcriptional regulator NrdR family protein
VPCPRCGKDSQVIITRRDGDEVNRRRVCKGRAEHLFDTVEMYHARAG